LHDTLSDVVTIVGGISAALIFMFVLQRVWAPEVRRRHNDVLGPSVNVIGTTYAVLIAFMLSGVWSNFRQAESNAEEESNSLVNLFRIANGLPSSDRDRLHRAARQYAKDMVEREWPAMQAGTLDPDAYGAVHGMWDTLTAVTVRSPLEQVSLDRSIAELARMTEYRRIRQLQSRSQLPALLWAVLVVGAIVTVGSSCLYGVEDLKVHIVQVFCLSFLIILVLVAIGNVDRPFQGSVRVDPIGFQFAAQTFDREMALDGH